MTLPFLGWYDPDPDVPIVDKLGYAMIRFQEKYGHEATHALVNEFDAPLLRDQRDWVIQIRGLPYIQPNTFYVGDNPGP